MKALSQLVEEKRQTMNMQQIMAKPRPVEEENWVKCKQYVDDLPMKYQEIIIAALTHGEYVKKFVFNGYTNLQLYRRINGYEVLVAIAEDKHQATKQVIYYAFNNKDNVAYLREVIKHEKNN